MRVVEYFCVPKQKVKMRTTEEVNNGIHDERSRAVRSQSKHVTMTREGGPPCKLVGAEQTRIGSFFGDL